MMMLRPLALVAGFAMTPAMAAGAAQAGPVALGTAKGGATAQVSTALANVITKGSSRWSARRRRRTPAGTSRR